LISHELFDLLIGTADEVIQRDYILFLDQAPYAFH